MDLVAFSNIAIDWTCVFAATLIASTTKGAGPDVILHVDAPGADSIEIPLTQKDAQYAIEKLKADRDRFHAVGHYYFELSSIFRITVPQDPGETCIVLFALSEDRHCIIPTPHGETKLLLQEIRQMNP
jgi:hypothetical protein